TDQDGDLPVWIVLPPGGTGHSQGDCEPAADQGMPSHGSLSANGSWQLRKRMVVQRVGPVPARHVESCPAHEHGKNLARAGLADPTLRFKPSAWPPRP